MSKNSELLYSITIQLLLHYCNNSTAKAHKRAFRAVYQNWDASLKELLDVDGSVKIHTRNL